MTSSAGTSIHGGKRRFVIAMREPWDLPHDEIELPPPEKLPNPPAQMNLLTLILPPAVMVGGTLIYSLISGNANLGLIAPMMIMSLGYPIANIISLKSQKKKYDEKLAQRAKHYVGRLKKEVLTVEKLVEKQRGILEREYPALPQLREIGLSGGESPRLWWRRAYDSDFLSLRVGSGRGEPSFTISPPKMIAQDDPLVHLPWEFIERYQVLQDLPLLVDLKRAGSLLVSARSAEDRYALVQRLLADLVVHHSPEEIDLALLTDDPGAESRWGWLKWTPHTHTFEEEHGRSLAFTDDDINNFLFALKKLFEQRLEAAQRYDAHGAIPMPAVVVILDDMGRVRQLPETARMAALGYSVGIYLVFVGEQNTPNTCRARLEADGKGGVHYLETWEAEGRGGEARGEVERGSLDGVEELARALAGLEVAGGKSSVALPSSVRLSTILGNDPLSLEAISSNWARLVPETDQVLFPIGQYVERTGLGTFEIDFRPESLDGTGEYHALLIGTTGSGKSIFLQAMVLATAHKYSPKLINFLFMDFKAGAAELNKIKELPHVVGMINDLSPALAERALQALENELSRRQLAFDRAGKITDVWDYNRRNPDQALPHLLVVIDEFAEGIKILPNLVERLRDLGRRGRAFGMYFFLANQEVNSAVDSLKSNVGWYVVLKVKRMDEMSLIDKNLPIAPGKGRGYVRVKSDITRFQGAYAGMPVLSANQTDSNEYTIWRVDADGRRVKLHEHRPQAGAVLSSQPAALTEQEVLVAMMQEAARHLEIEAAQPIYIDPLATHIPLRDVLQDVVSYRRFQAGGWSAPADINRRLVAAMGYLDVPDACLQPVMEVDFNDVDGHLWVVGNPGSGVPQVLQSLLFSLAVTHQPDEVQFYILECGSSVLKPLEGLPHTGAFIRSSEKERVERLIKFLDDEMERRNGEDWRREGLADLFVVVNNFAELQADHPDQAEAMTRYVRAGKAAGIHLVVATNRGGELNRKISSNIARRIVLKLSTRDEYMDVTGQMVPALIDDAPGRGYWVGQRLAACQVASPEVSLTDLAAEPTINARRDGEVDTASGVNQLMDWMRKSWEGEKPSPVETLPDQITFSDAWPRMAGVQSEAGEIWAPVGIDYESLDWVKANLLEEIPNWLIVGPRQSGKTNFLMSLAQGICQVNPGRFEMRVLALRRSPFTRLAASACPFPILTTNEDIIEELKILSARPAEGNPRRYVLLVDDLGGAFEPGKEAVAAALNDLALKLAAFTDVNLVVTGMREELQPQFSSALVKVLKQSRTGLAFSNDASDLDWLGAQVSLRMRKVDLPAGRGFFVSKGKAQLVQIPWMDNGQQFEV
jgi:S-DNA-T family DNA segregation ATPase FtsK/SpoIIIE